MAVAAREPWLDPWATVEPEASRRMLLAAVQAFADRGYHATTTRDIAARAGLSPAALYVHYPSKAALLAHISRLGHESALALVTHAATQGEDDVERLDSVVRHFVSWHAEHRRTARVVQYEFDALPADSRASAITTRRAIEQLVEELIRSGTVAGTMAVTQPRRVARAILSLGIDVARWYDPAGRDSPEDLGALYVDLARRMVGATPRSQPDGPSRENESRVP